MPDEGSISRIDSEGGPDISGVARQEQNTALLEDIRKVQMLTGGAVNNVDPGVFRFGNIRLPGDEQVVSVRTHIQRKFRSMRRKLYIFPCTNSSEHDRRRNYCTLPGPR